MQFEKLGHRCCTPKSQLCPCFRNVAHHTINGRIILRQENKPAQKLAAPT
jgi:hypothetical protein